MRVEIDSGQVLVIEAVLVFMAAMYPSHYIDKLDVSGYTEEDGYSVMVTHHDGPTGETYGDHLRIRTDDFILRGDQRFGLQRTPAGALELMSPRTPTAA